jgi:phosphate transport system substrate-binding protein
MKHQAILVIALMLLSGINAVADTKSEYVGAGSGVNTPVMKLLAEAFSAQSKGPPIKILPSLGTPGGIKALEAGRIDFALASRALKVNELTIKSKVFPYAKSILTFTANPSVKDTNISRQDVIDIYSGVKTTWSDKSTILVIMREEGDSGADFLVSQIPELKTVFANAWKASSWRVEFSDTATITTVSRLKNSIAWSDYSNNILSENKTKVLSYNKVTPSEKSVKDGSYPLTRELTIIHKDPLPSRLQEFFNFIKSQKGTSLLRQYHAVPIE